jgi:hypothetical protein
MFLTHKTLKVPYDCEWHGEQWHYVQFVRYNVSENRIVIRTICEACHNAGMNEWIYYEAIPFTFYCLLVQLKNNDFFSEN